MVNSQSMLALPFLYFTLSVWGTWENKPCSVNATASWFPLLKPSLI